MAHTTHFSRDNFWPLVNKFEILEDFQKIIYTFFGEKRKFEISDPWGSKWKLSMSVII